MRNESPVSGDSFAPRHPDVGDKVRITFDAEWWQRDCMDGHRRVYDPVGGYRHTIPEGARVELLTRKDGCDAAPAVAQETAAELADRLIVTFAEVARQLRVMISLNVSPYDAAVDEE